MTFQQLCVEMRCTPAEQEQLAWHLGQFRARKTYEKLRTYPIESEVSREG